MVDFQFQVGSSIEVEWKLFVWGQERYKSSHTAGCFKQISSVFVQY